MHENKPSEQDYFISNILKTKIVDNNRDHFNIFSSGVMTDFMAVLKNKHCTTNKCPNNFILRIGFIISLRLLLFYGSTANLFNQR